MPSRELCVYCRRREAVDEYRPFCSERCKMADLGRWLSGDYRVPGQPAAGPEGPDDPQDDAPDSTGRGH